MKMKIKMEQTMGLKNSPDKKFPGMVSRRGVIKSGLKQSGKRMDGGMMEDGEVEPGTDMEEQEGGQMMREDSSQESFPVIIATESPAVVVDWSRWELIREVLLMSGCELPPNNQLVMLDRHSYMGGVAGTIKGSFRNLRIEGDMLAGDAFFSTLAPNELILAREGHLTDVSCGYETYDEHTLIIKPGEKVVSGGRTYSNDFTDGMDLYIRLKWKPKEGSLVAIGADEDSKFREDQVQMLQQEVQNLKNEINQRNSVTINSRENKTMAHENELKPEDILRLERERVAEIEAYGQRFASSLPDSGNIVRQAVKEGWDANKFRSYVLDHMDTSKPVETPGTLLDMSEREIQSYSITRAINSILDGRFQSENSLEREASDAVSKAVGKGARNNAFYLPADLGKRLNNQGRNERSVLSTASASLGKNLVPTDYRGGAFIELLRNKAALGQLGMTILSGLKGDLVIPKQLTPATFEMSGYSAATGSNMTFDQVKASPKYGSATTEYHRSLLLQGDPSIDSLITNDLFAVTALGIDKYAIRGTGTGNEPKGFLNVTGIGSVDLSQGISWEKVIEFKKNIKKANADTGDIKWLMNPESEAAALTTPKAGAYPIFLMGDDGKMAACDSAVTNQMLDAEVVAGVFNQLVLCDWNLYEVLVNPYGANSKAGNTEVTIFAAFDVILRQAAAICASTNRQ